MATKAGSFSFVDRLPAKVLADRFGYSPGYINLLRHQFDHTKVERILVFVVSGKCKLLDIGESPGTVIVI